jgi:dihydropteroate synthase
MHLTLPNGATLSLDRPVIVGVLNLTPDSFSDGGRFDTVESAVEHAQRMVGEGADVIEVGGESTRPGAQRVDVDEQLRRIVPAIRRLRDVLSVPLSIDTTRATVAEAALDAGASIVNDVSAGRDDPQMFAMSASRGVPVIVMHMRGEPATMQQDPVYEDVASEVRQFLLERAAAARSAGVPRDQIVIDPGIGFGKTSQHNLTLLAQLDRLVDSGYPVMLGASRKRFLGAIVKENEPARRDAATAATTALAVAAGVRMLRVHDVRINRHAADVASAVRGLKVQSSRVQS